MTGQNFSRKPNAEKPNDRASFHELYWVPKLAFQQVGHFFHSIIKYYTFFVKNYQKLNAGAKIDPGKT